MSVATPAPVGTPLRPSPPPPPRLAERALAAAKGDRYEALWAAVQVYRRLLEEVEE